MAQETGKISKRTAIDFFRYTEIGDLDPTLIVDENVGALDVAMDYVTFVEIVEALEDLADKVLDEGFLKRTVIAQERSYGATRNVFQENVEKIVVNR